MYFFDTVLLQATYNKYNFEYTRMITHAHLDIQDVWHIEH